MTDTYVRYSYRYFWHVRRLLPRSGKFGIFWGEGVAMSWTHTTKKHSLCIQGRQGFATVFDTRLCGALD